MTDKKNGLLPEGGIPDAPSVEINQYAPTDYTPTDQTKFKMPGDMSEYHAFNKAETDPEQQGPQGFNAGDVAKNMIPVYQHVRRWREYLIALLAIIIVGMFIYIQFQRVDVKAMEVKVAKQVATISQITTERDIALNNAEEGRKAILDQNTKIDESAKIRIAQQKQMKALELEIAQLIKDGKVYKKANDVRNQPTPTNCNEVLDFLNRNTQHEKTNLSGILGSGSVPSWLRTKSDLQDAVRREEGTGAYGGGPAFSTAPNSGNK